MQARILKRTLATVVLWPVAARCLNEDFRNDFRNTVECGHAHCTNVLRCGKRLRFIYVMA